MTTRKTVFVVGCALAIGWSASVFGGPYEDGRYAADVEDGNIAGYCENEEGPAYEWCVQYAWGDVFASAQVYYSDWVAWTYI